MIFKVTTASTRCYSRANVATYIFVETIPPTSGGWFLLWTDHNSFSFLNRSLHLSISSPSGSRVLLRKRENSGFLSTSSGPLLVPANTASRWFCSEAMMVLLSWLPGGTRPRWYTVVDPADDECRLSFHQCRRALFLSWTSTSMRLLVLANKPRDAVWVEV